MRSNILKKIIFPVFLVITFFVVVGILYSPVLFKGYPAEIMNPRLVLGRNFAQSGIHGFEDDLNIVVAPELVESRVNPSSMGNKLDSLSWSCFFKIFGWQDWNTMILVLAIIMALGCIIFTITIRYLFGWQVATIFPFIYALLPFNQSVAQYLGNYEFGLLFFSFFILLYFWGRNQKLKLLYLPLAGIFLALSCLAKEALFLFLPIFFLWLLINKYKRELLFIFVPVIALLLVFWLPEMIGLTGKNDYSKFFVTKQSDGVEYSDFSFYAHIYADPYSYHFNKEAIDQQLGREAIGKDNSWLYRLGRMKVGMNIGVRQIGFFERLAVGTSILVRHVFKHFAIEYMGGPLIFLLMLVGFHNLRNRDKKLYQLFLFWLIGVPLLLSYVVLAIRSHLMDYGLAIAGLTALGLVSLLPILKNYIKYPKVVYIFLLLTTLYSLVLAGHVLWGRVYDNSTSLEIKFLADKVKNFEKDIAPEDVIAVGQGTMHPSLNYLTSKSVVFFSADTINKLIQENSLQAGFDKFNIKYIIGYNQELSELITKNSQVTNIASWPKKEDIETSLTYDQGWLLNLIK